MDTQPATTQALPTIEQMHAFLSRHYKHDRFEGRNGSIWGTDYSMVVARSHHERLQHHSDGWISQFEHRSGNALHYVAADVLAVEVTQ